jgi:hypothetical protein
MTDSSEAEEKLNEQVEILKQRARLELVDLVATKQRRWLSLNTPWRLELTRFLLFFTSCAT